MTRKTLASRIVEAPEKAPVTAWIFFALLLTVWSGRMYLHLKAGAPKEDWQHSAIDAAFLLGAACAAPGFMRFWARNAGIAIDLYKKFRSAKTNGGKEGDR